MKAKYYFLFNMLWFGINLTTAQIVSPGIAYPGSSDSDKASGPYFGQTAPGTTPKRFASSKIPLGAWAITFSPDGLECFITQNINNINTLLTSKETGGTWPDFTVAPFSGTYTDMESVITPDGERMYFGSMRPLPDLPSGILYQWYVNKTDIGWSEPKPMDPPLFGEFMMFPSIANNKNMYYTASDGVANQWIALSRFIDGQYQEPVILDDSINSTPWPAHPFIAPDESYIIFDAVTDTTNWARDLYICFRKPDSTWTSAINLGSKFNQATYSMFPFVSRDGKYFFFYKDNYMMWVDTRFIEQLRPRYGDWLGEIPPDTIPKMFAKDFISSSANNVYSCTFSPDGNEFYYSNLSSNGNNIWKTERNNNTWTKPVLAPFPQSKWTIEPNFSPDGNTLFFVSDMPDIIPGPPYNPTLRIWTLEKTDTGWMVPLLLHGPFSEFHKMFPTVANNRNLYFTEVIGERGYIYKSEWSNGGGYQTPVKLDGAINGYWSHAHPFIAPDESFIVFDASPEGPQEWNTYIYISYRNQNGIWGKAQRLPASINNTGGEYCGYVSSDLKYLFFARNTPEGGTNLWWVKADRIFHPTGMQNQTRDGTGSELYQNFPNPVIDNTVINFSLVEKEYVNLTITDVSGRLVRTLISEKKEPGKISIHTDLSDLQPGIYICRLKTATECHSIKITVTH